MAAIKELRAEHEKAKKRAGKAEAKAAKKQHKAEKKQAKKATERREAPQKKQAALTAVLLASQKTRKKN